MEPAVPGVSAYSLPKNGEKKQKTIVDRTVGGPKERCSKMICRSQEKGKKTGGKEKRFSRLKENGEETKKVQFFSKRKLLSIKNNFTQNGEK